VPERDELLTELNCRHEQEPPWVMNAAR
jgi:hypothetical protein